MRVLLLGETGAMGFPLVDILSKDSEKEVFVTTRKNRVSNGNVHYLIGNAKDEDFLKSIIKDGYDVIIDLFHGVNHWRVEKKNFINSRPYQSVYFFKF